MQLVDFRDIPGFVHADDCDGMHTTCELCERMNICCNEWGAPETCEECAGTGPCN